MLPRNTPGPVIATLNKEVNQVLATDSCAGRQIEVDYQARGELVRALGITGE
jgi:hypothetical protein